MIKTKPRIPPLEEAAWTDETRELLSAGGPGGRVLNIFATFAQHPRLLKRWTVFAGHVLHRCPCPRTGRRLELVPLCDMKPPFDMPVAYTRSNATQLFCPTSSMSAETKATSSRLVSENSQQSPAFPDAGEPAPFGWATMKFSRSATVSMLDHISCWDADERKP
jgi:hypothetical protein